MTKVLIIDDDRFSREVFVETLSGLMDVFVTQCDSGHAALKLLRDRNFDIIFSDIKMPGMSGIELLREYKKIDKVYDSKFVLFTGFATIDSAVKAIREGAYDYLLKPLDIRRVFEIVKTHSKSEDIDEELPPKVKIIKHEKEDTEEVFQNGSYMVVENVGRIGVFNPQMKKLVLAALKFHENPDINVLIQGETGTGKEVFANIIHHGQLRNADPFLKINCSVASMSSFEAELFGYVSKSGKVVPGLLDRAQTGTVMFDEIADLDPAFQPKLLRVLQDKAYYRVGGTEKIDLQCRFIATSNKDVDDLADKKKFRSDLLYRLKQGWINIPPLREQIDSVPLLAQLFLNQSSSEKGRKFKFISPTAIDIMQHHQWSGNVRELKNVIDRVAMLYDEFELNEEHLSFLKADGSYVPKTTHKFTLKVGNFDLPDGGLDFNDLQAEIVTLALEKFRGNRSKVARYLNVSISTMRTLYKRIDRNNELDEDYDQAE